MNVQTHSKCFCHGWRGLLLFKKIWLILICLIYRQMHYLWDAFESYENKERNQLSI